MLAPVLQEFAVPFRVNRGFTSATAAAAHDIAEDTVSDDKPLTALYVGDYAPSGLYMSQVDLPQRLEEYDADSSFELHRIAALVAADLPGMATLSFRPSTSAREPRYRWFVTRYGQRCWELDAMNRTPFGPAWPMRFAVTSTISHGTVSSASTESSRNRSTPIWRDGRRRRVFLSWFKNTRARHERRPDRGGSVRPEAGDRVAPTPRDERPSPKWRPSSPGGFATPMPFRRAPCSPPYVANRKLDGDPVWLMLVGGSGVGKTERLIPLAVMRDVVLESSITGPAALLSGTAKKERAKNATGGLLRKLPEGGGMLLLKDFTSIIDMHRDARAEVLAALREIYDGRWDRIRRRRWWPDPDMDRAPRAHGGLHDGD